VGGAAVVTEDLRRSSSTARTLKIDAQHSSPPQA